ATISLLTGMGLETRLLMNPLFHNGSQPLAVATLKWAVERTRSDRPQAGGPHVTLLFFQDALVCHAISLSFFSSRRFPAGSFAERKRDRSPWLASALSSASLRF